MEHKNNYWKNLFKDSNVKQSHDRKGFKKIIFIFLLIIYVGIFLDEKLILLCIYYNRNIFLFNRDS